MLLKFENVGLSQTGQTNEDGNWMSTFFFSEDNESVDIPWVKTFSHFFADKDTFQNTIYFGAYLFENDKRIFALSFGKSHFYIRPFADYDFGIEMAKRIADENEIKQTSSKRYCGKENKKIRSFQKNSRLDIESGETLDYLSASITLEQQKTFGKSGKFGSSLLLTPDIAPSEISDFLDNIETALAKEERFKIPRTVKVIQAEEISLYDAELLQAIKPGGSGGNFTSDSFETVGVDFIFSGSSETYRIALGRKKTAEHEDLGIEDLRVFAQGNSIPDEDLLNIRIERNRENEKSYSCKLKEALDFTIKDKNVILVQGHWLQFNEDYVDQLNEYVDSITLDTVEECFESIHTTEPVFIDSPEILALGYKKAHTDFGKFKLANAPSAKVEAWDLMKDQTVYAVKFGTAQKLGYVCDQAVAVLEILRNKANVKKLEDKVESYCLWLGYEAHNTPTQISQCNSIILKQKIDSWARKCHNLGITPKLKICKIPPTQQNKK